MSSNRILLAGAGGHARSCIDVIEREGRFEIAGLAGLAEEVGGNVFGYPIIGTEDDLAGRIDEFPNVIVTAGQIKSPDLRIRLYETFAKAGHVLPAIISPGAIVSPHAHIGAGTIVMHGAIVNAGAQVGRNCIINSRALVEHDAMVGDHCHISTAAVLNGGVQVQDGTFVGSGSAVRQSVVIGARCVVGMGQRVLADCSDGTWIPARKVV